MNPSTPNNQMNKLRNNNDFNSLTKMKQPSATYVNTPTKTQMIPMNDSTAIQTVAKTTPMSQNKEKISF